MRRCGIAGPAHTAQDRQIGPGCPAWNPTLLRQDIAAFTQKLCRGCFESMHYRLCTCPVLARQMPTHSTASLTARSALHLSTLFHLIIGPLPNTAPGAGKDENGRLRSPTAVAWSLQRYLIFAILSCVPDRQVCALDRLLQGCNAS